MTLPFLPFWPPGHLPDSVTQILTRLRITDERYGLRRRHLDASASAAVEGTNRSRGKFYCSDCCTYPPSDQWH
jgi:hypothetical protein